MTQLQSDTSHIEQCRAFLSSLRDKGVMLSEHVVGNTVELGYCGRMDVEDWLEISCYTSDDLRQSALLEKLI